MARPDGRIEAGEPLASAISARAWNRAQDAADIVLNNRPMGAAGALSSLAAPYTWVYGKNTTSSTVQQWTVRAISGVEVTPTNDANAAATKQFQSMPVLRVGPPEQGQPWCVALEPIPSNAIGKVAVAGAVQVKATSLPDASGSTTLWENNEWALIRFGGGGTSAQIRLAQTSGVWPNEPPLNVKAVQLFKQPAEPAGPADWIPETDEFGDPVFAVAINWFSHVPVGQGDLIKWCAVVPISNLEGEYDTGQVTYQDGQEIPIMRPYSKLWLLIAVEC